jgi:hypothetical protein
VDGKLDLSKVTIGFLGAKDALSNGMSGALDPHSKLFIIKTEIGHVLQLMVL